MILYINYYYRTQYGNKKVNSHELNSLRKHYVGFVMVITASVSITCMYNINEYVIRS